MPHLFFARLFQLGFLLAKVGLRAASLPNVIVRFALACHRGSSYLRVFQSHGTNSDRREFVLSLWSAWGFLAGRRRIACSSLFSEVRFHGTDRATCHPFRLLGSIWSARGDALARDERVSSLRRPKARS